MALTACGGRSVDGPGQVVAQVNGTEISVHQLNQALQGIAARASQRGAASTQDGAAAATLERLIEQELAVQQALNLDLDRDPAVMQALTAARREVLARAWLERMAGTVSAPTASEVRAYVQSRPERFAQRRVFELQELTVPVNAAQLESLREALARAKNFDAVLNHLRVQRLTMQVSQSTQAAEALSQPMLDRLLVMREGQAILLASPGVARIIVLRRVRQVPLTFEQVQAQVAQALAAERRREAMQSALQRVAATAEVRRLGGFAAAASDALPSLADGSPRVAPGQPRPAQEQSSAAPGPQNPADSMAPARPRSSVAASAASADDQAVQRGLAGLR